MIFLKRTHEMKIRFTREELDALNGKARRAGLSRESYCRHILNGAEVKEAPPADVPTLIREVRRVGCNIDQLLVDCPRKELDDCEGSGKSAGTQSGGREADHGHLHHPR